MKKLDPDKLYVVVNAETEESPYIPWIYDSESYAKSAASLLNQVSLNKYKVISLASHMENVYNRSVYLD